MAAPTADHNSDVDIVARALAILDEESRQWASQRPGPGVKVEGASRPGELGRDRT